MQIRISHLVFGTLIVSLSACHASFSAPASVRGPIPLIVANQAETGLCSFQMGPVDSPGGREEWIGLIKPQPGSATKFDVKPGVYWLLVKGCVDSFVAGRPRVVVNGPTNLVLVPMNRQAPPAYRHLANVPGYGNVSIPVMYTRAYLHPPQSDGGGDATEEPAGEEPAGEEPAAEQPSASGSRPSEPKNCLPSGTKTDNYHRCCSDAAKTQIEASENIFTCA